MTADGRPRAPFGWIAAVAFASGFPFGLVNEALPVFLRSSGAGLTAVGLVTAATFPWTFKFLWAPLVDRCFTRRAWIVASLAGLAALVVVLARLDPAGAPTLFWLLLVALVALSATQDVAIDAFTIAATPAAQLGLANSVRIAAYRMAMLASGGALVWFAGRAGWPAAIGAGAGALLLLALAATRLPEAPRPRTAAEPLWAPITAFLRRPGIMAVLAFALLFKLGDAAMDPMTRPFWVDRGFTLAEIGAGLTTGRLLATLGGAMLGGLLTTRLGLFTALWSLGALQALSNLGYWWAAAAAPSKGLVVAAALTENFCGGMGTAAFVAYLMSVCEARFAGTQYAILSALLALTRAVIGGISGGATERLGYASYFLLTFVLALPGFALLPWLPRVGRPPEGAPTPTGG